MSRSGLLPPVYKLAEVVGTGASGVMTVTIPATPAYEKLVIEVGGRSDAAAQNASVRMTVNGNTTAADYDYQYISAAVGAIVAAENVGANAFILAGFVPGATGVSANQIGTQVIEIMRYLNTSVHKPIRIRNGGGYDYASGAMLPMTVSGSFESTAAVASVTFTLSAGNWTSLSYARAYGWI